jgi:hypothetical protein
VLARYREEPPHASQDRRSTDLHHNCPPEIILGRLQDQYDYGDGRKKKDPYHMIFHSRNCNYPQPKYAKWFLTQYRRWGMVEGTRIMKALPSRWMRTDPYEETMKEEIGYKHGGLVTTLPLPCSGSERTTAPASRARDAVLSVELLSYTKTVSVGSALRKSLMTLTMDIASL